MKTSLWGSKCILNLLPFHILFENNIDPGMVNRTNSLEDHIRSHSTMEISFPATSSIVAMCIEQIQHSFSLSPPTMVDFAYYFPIYGA